ncbi:unnamed protein product, partial [Durusdinium trenchii]
DYGEKSRKPDPAVVQKVTGILTEKFKVEVKHASVSDPTYTDAILSPGKLKLDNGETLDFDVYIPCYPVRPNTAFLTGGEGKQLLDASGAIISNECLQSQAYPEVFGVGVTTTKVPGHPVSARITIASQHCGKQALALLQGKEVQKFVDKGTPPPMDHPMNMKIGHGPGGYMIWSGLPGPAKICCCQCCGGGFPFCPPPCGTSRNEVMAPGTVVAAWWPFGGLGGLGSLNDPGPLRNPSGPACARPESRW